MKLEEAFRMQNKFIKKVKGKEYNKENGWHAYYDDELIELGQAISVVLQALEGNKTNLEEKDKIIDKYLQKLVYTLSPTTHELSTNNNEAFKRIIAENIDLETCKIKRKLKEFWGIDKY